MKNLFLKFVVFIIVCSFLSNNAILAQQLLEGQNYKIVIPSISPSGDFLVSEDENYKMVAGIGQGFADPRLYSDEYMLNANNSLFEPFIPKVFCFETNTDGDSDCTTGPSFLNENGMVRVCGPSGCYDRARFEIDSQENPTNTLYGIQISTDNFNEDIKYLCGTTFMPKEEKTIEDFKTKANWEAEVFNILGLKPQTEYFIRIIALFGNLTESAPSEIATATTSLGNMSFRIGLGYENGIDINYNPPYEILFDEAFKLIRGANVQNSDRLIWTLIDTNSVAGITIVQRGKHGGLYNQNDNYTITSTSGNLDLVTEGFGLQSHTVSQLYTLGNGGLLKTITTKEEYGLGGNNVGIIGNIFKKIYESEGPIHTGRTALGIKTKASLTTPEGDYSEDITFVMIAKY